MDLLESVLSHIILFNFTAFGNIPTLIFYVHEPRAITYDERPKMKRDARLKAVFFPRNVTTLDLEFEMTFQQQQQQQKYSIEISQ